MIAYLDSSVLLRVILGQPDSLPEWQRIAQGIVSARAGHPLPVPLGTLDAIHLATATLWKERTGQSLTLATHDVALGIAARASGLTVIGV